MFGGIFGTALGFVIWKCIAWTLIIVGVILYIKYREHEVQSHALEVYNQQQIEEVKKERDIYAKESNELATTASSLSQQAEKYKHIAENNYNAAKKYIAVKKDDKDCRNELGLYNNTLRRLKGK